MRVRLPDDRSHSRKLYGFGHSRPINLEMDTSARKPHAKKISFAMRWIGNSYADVVRVVISVATHNSRRSKRNAVNFYLKLQIAISKTCKSNFKWNEKSEAYSIKKLQMQIFSWGRTIVELNRMWLLSKVEDVSFCDILALQIGTIFDDK